MGTIKGIRWNNDNDKKDNVDGDTSTNTYQQYGKKNNRLRNFLEGCGKELTGGFS